MKKIKDLIYNISDILVAIIILLLATGVILWRMNAVMDYPSTMVREGKPKEQVEIDTSLLPEEDESLWENGMLKRDLSITIPENLTDNEVIGILLDNKVFVDVDELERACTSNGITLSDKKPGEYRFTAGDTKERILNKIFNEGPDVTNVTDESEEE